MNAAPDAAGVALTGWAVHLPGVDLGPAVAADVGRVGAWADERAAAAADAATVVGRKGLLSKDPATRLALCAVHRALGWAPGCRRSATEPVDPTTAVVACGTLVNVATVARVARTVAAEGGRGVSVLDAPNVSSNIVASTVGLWFGFGGPNLAVASGPSASWDGLRLARLLLRAGRAERVVLVGVEPADPVAAAVHGGSPAPLREGAAAVVLTRDGPAPARLAGPTAAACCPAGASVGVGGRGLDPVAAWGDTYGASGVLALALAAHLAVDDGHGAVAVRRAAEPVATVRAAEAAQVARGTERAS